jgi:hypothetical protein
MIEVTKTILRAKELLKYLWAKVKNVVVHVLDKTTTQVFDGSTPFEKWKRRKFHISYFLSVWSLAYKHISKELGKKLDPKIKKMILA